MWWKKQGRNDDGASAKILSDPEHFESRSFSYCGLPVIHSIIKTNEAALLLGREVGIYVTIETGPLDKPGSMDERCYSMTGMLGQLLTPFHDGTLCIVGMGNEESVSDSLGTETVRRIPARDLDLMISKKDTAFQKIVAVKPRLDGSTSNTASIISNIVLSINADCVLLIDSTTCWSYDELCSRIDINNTGMTGHHTGQRLTKHEIGVPVISIGVPTAIPLSHLIDSEDGTDSALLTVNSISDVIKTSSYTIAYAIMRTCYPGLNSATCKLLLEDNFVW